MSVLALFPLTWRVWCLALIVGGGGASCLADEEKQVGSVAIKLTVLRCSPAESIVDVAVEVENRSGGDVLLSKFHFPVNRRLEAPFFSIKDAKGEAVSYRGILIKRRAPTEDDYVTLRAGAKTLFSVNIYTDYALIEGRDYLIDVDRNYCKPISADQKSPVQIVDVAAVRVQIPPRRGRD